MVNAVLRPAEAGDVEEIFTLYEKRVQWMNEKGIRQWNVTDYLKAYPLSYYSEQQQAGNLYVLEDLDSAMIMGAVVLFDHDERWADRAAEPALYVHNLVTDTVCSGGGSILLQKAESIARERGKTFMRLDCDIHNAFLNMYYESHGYQLAGKCQDGPYVGNRREKRLL